MQPAFSMLAEAHCPSYLVPPKICRFCKMSRLSFDFLKFFLPCLSPLNNSNESEINSIFTKGVHYVHILILTRSLEANRCQQLTSFELIRERKDKAEAVMGRYGPLARMALEHIGKPFLILCCFPSHP